MTRNTRSGFTLIELLIVVLIIAVLVVVLVAVLLAARGKGDENQARNFVNSVLTDAITRWQDDARGGDSNQYPPSGINREGKWFDGNVSLFEELILKPERAGRAPYMGPDQFVRGQLDNGKAVFVDPWGTPYIYRNFAVKLARDRTTMEYRGPKHNDTYDLISAGRDREFGTGDDIVNGKAAN